MECALLKAVREALKDIGEKDMDVEVLKCTILNEMYNRMDYYAGFHPMGKTPRNVLLDAENFFKYRCYTMDIVDVCIAATANALGVHLYIYEEIGNQAVIIQQLCAFQSTQKGIFLQYHHDRNDPKNLTAHYDAIVDIPCPSTSHCELLEGIPMLQVSCQSPTPETSSLPILTPRMQKTNYESPSTNSSHNTDLNEHQQIGEVTAPPYMPGTRHKRVKGSKGKLNLNLFEGKVPESVDKMPWDANGNSIYLIPTTEEYWHEKQLDGRHWIFTTSSKKGLNGIRKFGTCQGSLICMNPECPTWTTEQVCQ